MGPTLRTLYDIVAFTQNHDSVNPRKRNVEIIQSDLPIFTQISSTFVTVSSVIDGRSFLSLPWISVRPAATSLHYLHTISISMHDSPYTSVKWRMMNFKQRISTQTSHLEVALIETSIRYDRQEKTERCSEAQARPGTCTTSTIILPIAARTVSFLHLQRFGELILELISQ